MYFAWLDLKANKTLNWVIIGEEEKGETYMICLKSNV